MVFYNHRRVSLVGCHKPGYNSRTMNIASDPSLIVKDVPSVLELLTVTLLKQAQAGRTYLQAELTRINQILDESRHK